ncbi:MAG TPA: hypothetical protein VFX37_10575 [Pseudolabrys sp.]|nr:hypothetical protein [Pseudolabrys sp.]
MKRIFLALAFLAALPALASAQQTVKQCVPTGKGNSCEVISSTYPVPMFATGSSYTNITTNASTVIKAAPGTFLGIVVNTAGTTSTATVFDNTTCTGSKIGTFSTTAVSSLTFGISAATGICVTTAGSAAADITILWR